ncbi:MAG: small multi-drug export protein [Actinobacteria bacterium]|nr:small multi-drug export protein [Actinomycetota bacterium]
MPEFQFFKELPPEVVLFILSMLPLWELRGSIPLGIHAFSMTAFSSFFWSFLGNFTAGVLLVYLLEPAVKYVVTKVKFLNNFYEKVAERAKRKHAKKVELYAEMAIFIIVALPLPGTGAWTGALVSRIFRLNKKASILSIGLGLIVCGLIVLGLSSSISLVKL